MKNFLKLASLFLFAAAILLPNNLLSQEKGFYKELMAQTDFVFEGEIMKSTGKWNAEKTMIYTEHEIRLSQVFKGDLRNPTIQLVTLGGETEEQFVIAGDALQLLEGYKGVFFAQERAFGILAKTVFGGAVCFANDPAGFIPKRFNESSTIPMGFGASYQKEKYDMVVGELGDAIVQFPHEVPTGNVFELAGCNSPDFESSAEITFQNFEVTGNLETVELDIMIKALPQGTKFGKCEFILTFPTNVFGQYVFQNNLLTITKGDVVQSADYVLSVSDQAQNKVKISVNLSGNFTTTYSLTGNVEKLFHCAFSIANPLGIPGLTSDDFKLEGNVWYECNRGLYPFRYVNIKTHTDVVLPNFENLIGINYQIQKFNLTTNNQLRFDIYANAGDLSLFRTAELYIDLSTTAFPSNLALNFQTTKGELIAGTVDVGGNLEQRYIINKSNQGTNTIKLEILPNPIVGDAGLAMLGNEPVRLLIALVTVSDCTEDADIVWNDLTNNANHTYMETGSAFQYLPVTYSGGLATPMCGCNLPDPVITGFSEANVRAGTGERLTIEGENFGDVIVDGSCFIQVYS